MPTALREAICFRIVPFMRWLGLPLLLGLVVLPFGGAVYAACRSWRKMSAGKRIMGGLLLSPHFLLLVCFVVSFAVRPSPARIGLFQQTVCMRRFHSVLSAASNFGGHMRGVPHVQTGSRGLTGFIVGELPSRLDLCEENPF